MVTLSKKCCCYPEVDPKYYGCLFVTSVFCIRSVEQNAYVTAVRAYSHTVETIS